ncbi:hypothetical protein Ancab_019811 [Ancistrocladus abbreviatus]
MEEEDNNDFRYTPLRYILFCGLEAEKRRHAAAVHLIKELVKSDLSWEHSSKKDIDRASIHQSRATRDAPPEGQSPFGQREGDQSKSRTAPETPLLIAASNGIIEIVDAILKEFPQAIEHIDPTTGENILHTTIQSRQWEIFRRVKEERVPMRRMALRLDRHGNTILHQLAGGEFYGRDDQPNPALQLQDDLEWFEVGWMGAILAKYIISIKLSVPFRPMGGKLDLISFDNKDALKVLVYEKKWLAECFETLVCC